MEEYIEMVEKLGNPTTALVLRERLEEFCLKDKKRADKQPPLT